MPVLFVVIALPATFAAYSWYRHVFERECLALLREERALAGRARSAQLIARSARTGPGGSDRPDRGMQWQGTTQVKSRRSTST